MNWEKIRKKYKNAESVFRKWNDDQRDNSDPFEYSFSTRDLYDFFDQQGIRLFVSLADNHNSYQQGNTLPDRRFIIWNDKTHKSRVDAEYAAFEKGFELLEKRLKK